MLHHADWRLRLSSLSRFEPFIERKFSDNYYERIVSTLRLVAPFMVALLFVGLRLSHNTSAPYDSTIAVPQMVFWTAAFGLTWVKGFGRVWQPVLVVLALITSAWVLLQLPPLLMSEGTAKPPGGGFESMVAQHKFYFVLQFAVLIVPWVMLRLQFLWSAMLYGGVVTVAGWAFMREFPAAPDVFLDLHYVLPPAMLVLFPLLLLSYVQEHINRAAFWSAHQLEEERNDERRKHRQTEGQLHVLARAIGGIVHDLGNPLAAVQMGSETLDIFLQSDKPDKVMVKEMTNTINGGAKMLSFLRLSLIEQTRVLEGKPTPVERRPISVRATIQSGVRFQKPHVVGERKVNIQEGDAIVCADEMKMVTVWMNLIGNAFKYSDGEVNVRWRQFPGAQGNLLLIAVADQGTNGRGVSREGASRLFSAFGRLEAHANIEGTGLGLLSVQKIMEAHGGQAWIEGYEDGTPSSFRFSTAQSTFPAMLKDSDRTAFVVSCPLASDLGPGLGMNGDSNLSDA